jgi:hypothetical protein
MREENGEMREKRRYRAFARASFLNNEAEVGIELAGFS